MLDLAGTKWYMAIGGLFFVDTAGHGGSCLGSSYFLCFGFGRDIRVFFDLAASFLLAVVKLGFGVHCDL